MEPNEYNLQTTITYLSDSGITVLARLCHHKVIVGQCLMQKISNELGIYHQDKSKTKKICKMYKQDFKDRIQKSLNIDQSLFNLLRRKVINLH